MDGQHVDIVALLSEKGAATMTYDTDALELNKACAFGELHKASFVCMRRNSIRQFSSSFFLCFCVLNCYCAGESTD